MLRQIQKQDLEFELDPASASYFLSKVELLPGDDESMPRWRKHVFLALTHVAADAAEYFHLPRDRTLIVGARIYL